MGNLVDHAKREFLAAGYIPLSKKQEDGPNKWIQQNVLQLLRVFSKQGHSGCSADYCVKLFTRLVEFKPITPLTGADDEWNEVGPGVWQNKRCSSVFKDGKGRTYDIDGYMFREPNGSCWGRGKFGFRDITFPYTPGEKIVLDVKNVNSDRQVRAALKRHKEGTNGQTT